MQASGPARVFLKWLTSLGVGLIPGPRGTYGSALTAGAAALWLGLTGGALAGPGYLAFTAGAALLATAASQAALNRSVFGPDRDPGRIVIDEAAGQLIALYGLAGLGWLHIGLAFAGFRFFDIVKPWPINVSQRLPGGWGVVIDDVLAGFYTLGLLWLVRRLLAG